MFDRDSLYNVLDSHFVNRLVREGYQADEGDGADGATASDTSAAPAEPDMPDNMLDDLLDELDEALVDLYGEYGSEPRALTAASFGFIDGVLSYSDGSYTSYEDEYCADMRNARFAQVDAVVTEFSEEYEGNRNWDEAAMGYIRHVIGEAAAADGATDAPDAADGAAAAADSQDAPDGAREMLWEAQALGFIYGADLAEDYEWKVVQNRNGDIIVTDEESLQEFSMRQLEQAGPGGLLGKISDVLGIDLGALASALEGVADEEEEEAEDEANA